MAQKIHKATDSNPNNYGDVTGTSNLGYTFDFPSLSQDDIRVSVAGQLKTLTTDYTVEQWSATGSTSNYIKFNTSTTRGSDGTTVRIFRETPKTAPKASFTSGSAIKADDLNINQKQAIYVAEEFEDDMTNLAANDATGFQINGSNIADNSITTTKISGLEVKESDIDNGAVTTNKIANDAVTADKLANSINTTIAGKAAIGANISIFNNDSNYVTTSQLTMFVTGMIIMWAGTVAPTGWALCDGQNGRPDLRDKFIVGLGNTYSLADQGGANTVTLTESQMPSHNHTFSGSNTHSHDYKGRRGDDHNDDNYQAPVNQNDSAANVTITAAAAGGVQNATITISGDTGNKGSGSSHENRPPYYALAFIIKT